MHEAWPTAVEIDALGAHVSHHQDYGVVVPGSELIPQFRFNVVPGWLSDPTAQSLSLDPVLNRLGDSSLGPRKHTEDEHVASSGDPFRHFVHRRPYLWMVITATESPPKLIGELGKRWITFRLCA